MVTARHVNFTYRFDATATAVTLLTVYRAPGTPNIKHWKAWSDTNRLHLSASRGIRYFSGCLPES